MDKREIQEKLIGLGGHVANKGFPCIVEAIKFIKEDNKNVRFTGKGGVYKAVADELGMTSTSVKRSIRYEIERIYDENYDPPAWMIPQKKAGKLPNMEFLKRCAMFL